MVDFSLVAIRCFRVSAQVVLATTNYCSVHVVVGSIGVSMITNSYIRGQVLKMVCE